MAGVDKTIEKRETTSGCICQRYTKAYTVRENGKYTAAAYAQEDTLHSYALSGFVISLADVFVELS